MKKIFFSTLFAFLTICCHSQIHQIGILGGINIDSKGNAVTGYVISSEKSNQQISYGLTYNYIFKQNEKGKSILFPVSFLNFNASLNDKEYTITKTNDNLCLDLITHKSKYLDLDLYFGYNIMGNSLSNGFILNGNIGGSYSFFISSSETSKHKEYNKLYESNYGNYLLGASVKLGAGYKTNNITIMLSPSYSYYFDSLNQYLNDKAKTIKLNLSILYQFKFSKKKKKQQE